MDILPRADKAVVDRFIIMHHILLVLHILQQCISLLRLLQQDLILPAAEGAAEGVLGLYLAPRRRATVAEPISTAAALVRSIKVAQEMYG